MKNPVPSDKKRVLIVGAVHVDDIAKPDSTLVPLASNPVRWSQHIGGVGANAACAAARSLNQAGPVYVDFLATVGDDANAKQLERTLKALDINTIFKRFENTSTGRYSAIMNLDGELYIGLSDVSLAEQLSDSIVNELIDWNGVAAVLLDANLSASCLSGVANLAKKRKIPVAAMSVSPVKTQRLVAIADKIDLLFCNRREASAMTTAAQSSDSLDALADSLARLGFSDLVLTDGQQPVVVQCNNRRTSIDIQAVKNTHHVNGAGDALAGATFSAWAMGMDLCDAVREKGLTASAHVVAGVYKAPKIDAPSETHPV